MFIIMSCMISVSVNFSTFLVLGKTSAVTYQVLGHLKTCLILALGYLVLSNPFSWRNVCRILIALSGMALYSHACILESQQKAQENSNVSIQAVKESDILDPLVVAENGTAKVLPEDENDTSELLWNNSGIGKDIQV
jgi:solute carrier family 35 protein E3